MPYPTTTATPMNPSVKKWIKWMRLIQLVLRCFELLAALGLLVVMIMIKGLEESTGWIMRIVVSRKNPRRLSKADTICSPASQSFTLCMACTILRVGRQDVRLPRRLTTCSSPRSSTSRSSRSTPSALLYPRLGRTTGEPFSRTML